MKTIVFLLEEPSARELLRGIVPRMLPEGVTAEYLVFEGKQELERNIEPKLRGWRRPDSTFLILRDQDSAPDCRLVKQDLCARVSKSGRAATVRISCKTLEAFIAGDLAAVAKAFDRPSVAKSASERKFRDPDALGSAYDELRRLVPDYQKIDGARRVGPLLERATNSSASFRALWDAIAALAVPGPR